IRCRSCSRGHSNCLELMLNGNANRGRGSLASGSPPGDRREFGQGSANRAASAFMPERLWQSRNGGFDCHAMTCDVEDYFQVSAFEDLISQGSWDRMECRLPRNIDRVLEL